MENKTLKRTIQILTIFFTTLLICFIIYALHSGLLSSKEVLIDKIKSYGLIAPLIFMLIQIVQVIFPVIPGGASCLAGVFAFGPILGFIYNYIGLSIGSVCVFFISKKFGLPLIKKLFKEETVEKYLSYIRQDKFDKLFFWGIFIPGAPDDLLCYIAGITKIRFQTFLAIIILGKPLSLLIYSISIYYFPFFN